MKRYVYAHHGVCVGRGGGYLLTGVPCRRLTTELVETSGNSLEMLSAYPNYVARTFHSIINVRHTVL
jgi:hypothetical protein